MNAKEPFIICDNLVKIFKVSDHDVMALQGLDLIVLRGEMLGLVGVSGSGKSTLMNILGGLDRPFGGSAWAGAICSKSARAGLDLYRLTTVGIVWQHSGRNLVPYLNGLENIELPLTLAGYEGPQKRKRATRIIQIR